MKANELLQLPEAELDKRLDDAHRELFNLRFQKAQRQLSDMNSLRRVRKDIARLRTVQRQRELARQVQVSAAKAAATPAPAAKAGAKKS